ncbi:MAG: hypothetical protein OXE79_10225 [Acidimicrobiaceae bacterium]|nr:hypothetical protein [Acidimicrobiaceae bacterium]
MTAPQARSGHGITLARRERPGERRAPASPDKVARHLPGATRPGADNAPGSAAAVVETFASDDTHPHLGG